ATGALRVHLTQLEARLADGRPWLFGQAVSLADFSVYHPLWFVQQVKAVAGIFESFPRVTAWVSRVQALNRPPADELPSAEAVALARQSRPEPLSDEPFLDEAVLPRGTRVAICATDYGKDPVEGEFVLSRPNELAVRRTDTRAGEVVVHFPRLGFQVRALK
ncbi:MAG: glutathione S-transferase domain-containing protein, partial [Cystobacter sp.]